MYADGLWSNFYHGYIFFYHSTYFSQSLWINGSFNRLASFMPDSRCAKFISVPVASTCRRDGSHDLNQRLPYCTTSFVDKASERPCQDIYPEFQSRSNIVDGCVILRMVSPPQCVGVIVRTGTFITLHLLEFSAVEKALLHFRDNVKQKQISLRTDSILVS